ncbi:AbrB family transcriptional regulator [Mesobacillus subterraneus]|uniref:AbrB family transcriptional regulator n=1 Tax=Mesobacillus subterraneus TaxID=285983 RepID=A0A3R9EA43_9BACI|nr:AbrB family transcriptional regulator [Mesobacillus subterraneus]
MAALIIAIAGGFLFFLLQVPVPWLLGSMFAVLIACRFKSLSLYWPPFLRDTALVVVGYTIGLYFTRSAVEKMILNLPIMLALTVLVICFAAIIAKVLSKLSGVDYPTMLTGSIPGGLSQMILFAEETKGIDLTMVTFLQVSRLLMIVFFVPFIIFGPVLKQEHSNLVLIGNGNEYAAPETYLIFAIVCILSSMIGKRLRFPTPFLLGPILAAAILINAGMDGPHLPSLLMDATQLMIGGYIGMLMKPERLKRKLFTFLLAFSSSFLLVSGSLVMSVFLSEQLDISIVTAFLSLAPGGMDQMGIIAHEVKADLSIVTGFQLFRLFFIFFAIPPLLRWFFRRKMKG